MLPTLAGEGLGHLLGAPPLSEATGSSPRCRKKVSLHTYQGSPLEVSEQTDALQTRLGRIGEKFAMRGIDLEFGPLQCDLPRMAQTLYAREDESNGPLGIQGPNLFDFARDDSFASANNPAIIITERLLAWSSSEQRYLRKLGITPFPGANVAAVELSGTESDAVRIENELYHIFGLTDEEMGATSPSAQHFVTDNMWDFVNLLCKEGADNELKNALVQARERARQIGHKGVS